MTFRVFRIGSKWFGIAIEWMNFNRIEIHSETIRTIPIHSDICIRGNANYSEPIESNPIFNQNESEIRIFRIDSDWKFGLDQSELGLIRIDSDWKLGFILVRIHSDSFFGLNRVRSDQFFTVFHQKSYKTFFGLVRNDSHWLGYRYRNESEWFWFTKNEFLSDTYAKRV